MAEHELREYLVVLRCQAGDEQGFTRLFEWFGQRTLRYLQGLVGEDAEDVQQEVWLSVYRGIRGLSNPRAFRTWLYQTVRHRAIDFLRKRRRERELLDAAATELAQEDGSTAEESGVATPEQPELTATLAGLTPVQREVLLLRYYDDMSYAEIALVVGCSIGTVRSRLHHARRRMLELKGGA